MCGIRWAGGGGHDVFFPCGLSVVSSLFVEKIFSSPWITFGDSDKYQITMWVMPVSC